MIQNKEVSSCYGYRIYISYITYPIIPTQTFVIKISITLLIFLHILLYHASLLNSKKALFLFTTF